MNQEKIGKFIAEQRKKKKLTQVELAEKLGVTDRSISKWENGRGMPDVSLFEDLCHILWISVNELLKGETILNEDLEKISSANLIEFSKYKKNKSRNKIIKILFLLSILTIILFIFLLLSLNQTFFKARYNSEFLDNVSVPIPRFSYYRKTGGQYVSVFETLRSTDEIDVFINNYLSSLEKMDCNGDFYYYNNKRDFTITQYAANNDGYGFINTIYISYTNGRYCD